MDAKKALGKDAAIQEGAQFSLHEPRHVALPAVLPFQESLELCGDYPIKDAFFGISGTVNRGGLADGEAGLGEHEISTLVLILLQEKGLQIRVGHNNLPASCGLQAATYLTARQ